MMRLSPPQYTFKNTLDKCIIGITGNNRLKHKMQANSIALLLTEAAYMQAADAGTLHKIPALDARLHNDPPVVNDLTKSELKKIYETYFRPEEKPAREIYDHLLNAANDRCPYCGGIGRPRNLDHYLPVAHFPQFSVLPKNLVPACRDCNMDGDADEYAQTPEDQIIQPYVDHDRFFSEQWIFANCLVDNFGQPTVIRYLTIPPHHWSAVDKLRVQKHFEGFDLPKRYSTKAAELLGTTVSQIRNMRRSGQSDPEIVHVLLTPGVNGAPFTNHWQKGMFQALIHSLPQII